jgi:hypothetical protein
VSSEIDALAPVTGVEMELPAARLCLRYYHFVTESL